jgi:large subunit ribosomal protein L24e
MPRTRECDYCGVDIEPGTGTMFVRTDGTTIHYCSSKCENNASLGREARDLEWTRDEVEEPEEDAGSGEAEGAEEADETGEAEGAEEADETGDAEDADETGEAEEAEA